MVCAPVWRDTPPSFNEGIIDRTGAQTLHYLSCTKISSVDLAHYGVSHAKDWFLWIWYNFTCFLFYFQISW